MYYYKLISSMLKATVSTLLTGLYAVYKGESNANDSLGTYNGTAQGGLTYTTGKSGNAFVGNGTTSYVALPTNTMKFTNNFTISFWFKPNTSATSNFLFSNFHNDGSGDYGYYLYKNGANLIWRIFSFGNTNTITATIPSYTDNIWYHVVVTANSTIVDGYSNGVFVNKSLIASNTYVDAVRYSTTVNHYPTFAGRYYGSTPVLDYPLNGSIDEVCIWNRKLTPTEVTTLYNSGAGKFYPTF